VHAFLDRFAARHAPSVRLISLADSSRLRNLTAIATLSAHQLEQRSHALLAPHRHHGRSGDGSLSEDDDMAARTAQIVAQLLRRASLREQVSSGSPAAAQQGPATRHTNSRRLSMKLSSKQ
jgi:hypothetical protein